MKKIILTALFFINISPIIAQNTTFDNVSIGTSYPAYGTQMKINFPGYTGGWARAYSIVNESGSDSYFTFGSTGYATNGATSVSSNFIGKDLNTRYMTFLPNGNVGIGTETPSNLQGWGKVLDVAGANHSKILATSENSAYRVGIFSHNAEWYGGGGFVGTETNHNLHFLTNYNVKMSVLTNGNIGIGTTNPQQKLVVSNNSAEGFEVYLDPAASVVGLQSYNRTTYGYSKMQLDASQFSFMYGKVGIGKLNPSNELDVNGTIHSKEVKVDMQGWSDFVFKKEYKLQTLAEVEKHINEKGHLENIPSEEEVLKNGISLGEMNAKLLQKIEEMTLYIIEQEKKNNKQSEEIEKSNKQIELLQKENESFKLILERLSKIEQKLK